METSKEGGARRRPNTAGQCHQRPKLALNGSCPRRFLTDLLQGLRKPSASEVQRSLTPGRWKGFGMFSPLLRLHLCHDEADVFTKGHHGMQDRVPDLSTC